ncbi:MAG: hypothetical protein P9M15_04330, partial [Candidatus Electryoneaceae bacterium]|nr:hypothetical protein [Candidatus Electryoneaceae bacterium]
LKKVIIQIRNLIISIFFIYLVIGLYSIVFSNNSTLYPFQFFNGGTKINISTHNYILSTIFIAVFTWLHVITYKEERRFRLWSVIRTIISLSLGFLVLISSYFILISSNPFDEVELTIHTTQVGPTFGMILYLFSISFALIGYGGLKTAIGQGYLYRLKYRFVFLILIIKEKSKYMYEALSNGEERDLHDVLTHLADTMNIFTYVVPAFKVNPGIKKCIHFFE